MSNYIIRKTLLTTAILIILTLIIIVILQTRHMHRDKTYCENEKNDAPCPGNVDEDTWERFLNVFNWHKSNNVPINFYARVVDQNNDPVPGAKVNVHYIYFIESLAKQWSSNLEADETVRVELISDAEGRVELTDAKGSILYIDSIVKDGYIYPEKTFVDFPYAPDFRDGAILPTPKNPYSAKVWKKTGPASTTIKECTLDTQTNGKRYFVNLLAPSQVQENSDNVDLIVEMTAEPFQLGKGYDWRVTLNCPSGGMIETNDKLFYLAPESGYQESLSWQVNKNDPDYSASIEKNLYLKLRDGKIYCALRLEIYTYHTGNGAVWFSYVINDSGSRQLEHDKWK